MTFQEDADYIIHKALADCMPDAAVKKALSERVFPDGRIYLAAIGKAAWKMSASASEVLAGRLEAGVVITKYGHSQGEIENCRIFEGGHPVPDEGCYRGTRAVLELVKNRNADDTVIFLISGGGSALFELPLIPPGDMAMLTKQLLACGADINEMNTIRKRLSAVKGGHFAEFCAPASVFVIALSDVLGDRLDVIASGPASPDYSTCDQARAIVEKYHLDLTPEMEALLKIETPKTLDHVEARITGSVRVLCQSAAKACAERGYTPVILTDGLCCQAKEAGSFLASIARTQYERNIPLALIAGGETVVSVTGSGKGGRNQELALAAAAGIAGMKNVLVFSLGSDGTDGPTDAAGGMVDGTTAEQLKEKGLSIDRILAENDAYTALKRVGGLIMTGPTGTNVNDVAVVLMRPAD